MGAFLYLTIVLQLQLMTKIGFIIQSYFRISYFSALLVLCFTVLTLAVFTVHGFVGYSGELLHRNLLPDYTSGETFFTVFGVFFPAATGDTGRVFHSENSHL